MLDNIALALIILLLENLVNLSNIYPEPHRQGDSYEQISDQ